MAILKSKTNPKTINTYQCFGVPNHFELDLHEGFEILDLTITDIDCINLHVLQDNKNPKIKVKFSIYMSGENIIDHQFSVHVKSFSVYTTNFHLFHNKFGSNIEG